MKRHFFTTTMARATVFSGLLLTMAGAHAENVYLDGYYPVPEEPKTGWIKEEIYGMGAGPSTPVRSLKNFPLGSDIPSELTEMNKNTFGNAMTMTDGVSSAWITLPAVRKRPYVYTLQKKDDSGNFVDIAPFHSKKEAQALCNGLSDALKATYSVYFYHKIPKSFNNQMREYLYTDTPLVYVSDWGGGIRKVIAVAYNIAYDTGSTEQSADGKSTPAVRHHFCPNEWGWAPSSYWGGSNEDEFKGIRTSRLTEAGYEVTCMDSHNYPTTTFSPHPLFKDFWTNGKQSFTFWTGRKITEHELNRQLGARYCPVS